MTRVHCFTRTDFLTYSIPYIHFPNSVSYQISYNHQSSDYTVFQMDPNRASTFHTANVDNLHLKISKLNWHTNTPATQMNLCEFFQVLLNACPKSNFFPSSLECKKYFQCNLQVHYSFFFCLLSNFQAAKIKVLNF